MIREKEDLKGEVDVQKGIRNRKKLWMKTELKWTKEWQMTVGSSLWQIEDGK